MTKTFDIDEIRRELFAMCPGGNLNPKFESFYLYCQQFLTERGVSRASDLGAMGREEFFLHVQNWKDGDA